MAGTAADIEDIVHAIEIKVLATNFGLNPQTGVTVELDADWGPDSWTVDLPFVAMDTLVVELPWYPAAAGPLTLSARTLLVGDENAANDEVSITIGYGMDLVAVSPTIFASAPRPRHNPFRGEAELRFSLARETFLRLEIFDIAGRKIATPAFETRGPGEQLLRWNGNDENGRELPAGLYLYRLQTTGRDHSGKLLKLK